MQPKLRQFLHVAVAEALHYSGALSVWRLSRRLLGKDEACILGLHRVLTKAEQERSNSLKGMIIREETYLALLAYLQKRFDVVSLERLLSNADQDIFSKPRCLITFDDGWLDTYTRAFPGLKKLSLPAIVFLATGSVGTQGGFWVEQVKKAWQRPEVREGITSAMHCSGPGNGSGTVDLEAAVEWLKRMPTSRRDAILCHLLPSNGHHAGETESVELDSGGPEIDAMLTWEQARRMSQAGVEIGAHTVNHPLLSYEDADSVEYEVKGSKQAIEQQLGKVVTAFAYPNGDWNESVRDQVAKSGYRCAFTTRAAWYNGKENPFTVSRVLLHEGNITQQDGSFSPAMLNLTLAGWA